MGYTGADTVASGGFAGADGGKSKAFSNFTNAFERIHFGLPKPMRGSNHVFIGLVALVLITNSERTSKSGGG